jgi:hypothetical protein
VMPEELFLGRPPVVKRHRSPVRAIGSAC